MNERWHYCEQRTEEWRALRLGKVTASRMADLTAQTKSGWSTSRANYAAELVLERLTGTPTEHYVSPAMQYGTDKEAEALSAYCFATGSSVDAVGFIVHPTIDQSGCSPDGLVGDDGMVQIKCPIPATHLDTLLTQNIDGRYLKQIQWEMACAERKWCDYVSYRPDFPPQMQIFIKRVTVNDVMVSEMTGHVLDFLTEVAGTVANLKSRFVLEPA